MNGILLSRNFIQRMFDAIILPHRIDTTYRVTSKFIFGLTAMLIVIVMIAFGINVYSARQTQLNAAISASRTLTDLTENRMTNAFNTVNNELDILLDTLRLNSERPADHAFNEQVMKTQSRRLLEYHAYISVVDQTGNVRYRASRNTKTVTNVANRDYFAFHRDDISTDSHLGVPFKSRTTGHDVFTVSRRLTDQHGQFAGIIVAAVDITVFEKLYSSFKNSYGGSVLIMRDDGIVLARAPHVDGLVGSFNKPLYDDLQEHGPQGTVRRSGNADGVMRLISYKKLAKQPVLVAVGLDEADVLAAWRNQCAIYALIAVILTLFLIWIAMKFNAALRHDQQTSRELSAKREQLHGIVSSAMDAIITVNNKQEIVLFNESAERVFGHREKEALGQPLAILIPPSHRQNHGNSMKAFGESGVTSRMMGALGIVRGLRVNGTEFPAEASISQLKTDGEHFFTVIIRDITNRVRDQEMLARSHAELEQKVAERTRDLELSQEKLKSFNYAVSHDLRAPVRQINGFAEMILQDQEASGESVKHYLNRIVSAAHRMDGIIQGLLRLASASASQANFVPVNLASLITTIVNECAPDQWGGKVNVDLASLKTVLGDGDLLRQLFTNLVNNAFKFSSKTPFPAIEIRGQTESGGELIVSVEDNGAGFDMKYADQLFQPLNRLHRQDDFEGSGIGLATAKNIVDLHGGRIWAEGVPGRGATFSVALKTSP